MLTPEQIKEARALCDAPGLYPAPWKTWGTDVMSDPKGNSNYDEARTVASTICFVGLYQRAFNADFIAASRTLLPAALDTIEAKGATIAALQAENEGLRKALGQQRETAEAAHCEMHDEREKHGAYFAAEAGMNALNRISEAARAALSPAPQTPESRG